MEFSRIVDNADDAGNAVEAGASELEPLKAFAEAPHVAASNSRKKLSFNGVRKPPSYLFLDKTLKIFYSNQIIFMRKPSRP